eukprot:CAMPEP_0178454980 /NCGR_PEP_ID=MMETSP0689_2-20121128/45660_1 /TAXON_ID=160604 /ORGANISM="Amphidinium massartii, Strain CS-259" /LENGTH=297 /DNA_ID=CAMNT_0020080975 /DNA_START=261 /DNA_END=1151 /DNA_ORIENTATION=-
MLGRAAEGKSGGSSAATATAEEAGSSPKGGAKQEAAPPQEAKKKPQAAAAAEEEDMFTYFFGKPGELQRDLARVGITPATVAWITTFSLAIGLVSNLWGQTEFVFGLIPQAGQAARDLKLDSLYAVNGLKGYYEEEYSVRFPRDWLFDPTVQLAKMGQYSGRVFTSASKGLDGVAPDAAWGPMGGGQRPTRGRENMSVVRQRLGAGPGGAPVQIESILGEPNAALTKLLTEKIAPEGSKRVADALRAEVIRKGGNSYYEFTWRTRFDSGFALRTYSSAALGPVDAQGQRNLYTVTLV